MFILLVQYIFHDIMLPSFTNILFELYIVVLFSLMTSPAGKPVPAQMSFA